MTYRGAHNRAPLLLIKRLYMCAMSTLRVLAACLLTTSLYAMDKTSKHAHAKHKHTNKNNPPNHAVTFFREKEFYKGDNTLFFIETENPSITTVHVNVDPFILNHALTQFLARGKRRYPSMGSARVTLININTLDTSGDAESGTNSELDPRASRRSVLVFTGSEEQVATLVHHMVCFCSETFPHQHFVTPYFMRRITTTNLV